MKVPGMSYDLRKRCRTARGLSHKEIISMAKAKAPSDRSFGFTFVIVFALLAAWHGWLGRVLVSAFLTGFCVSTLLVTLWRPRTLAPLNRAWMKFGALLHAVVSPIMLGAMYFCVITPIALLMRLARRDALRRKREPNARTYWIDRRPPGPPSDSLPNQF